MKRFTVLLTVCVVVLVSASGCKKKEAAPTAAPASQSMPASTPVQGEALSGKVVETMNSGGYTYVFLEKNGKKTWAAIPAATVKVGQEMTLQPGMEMRNFTSKTLNRTFESIIFSGGPAH